MPATERIEVPVPDGRLAAWRCNADVAADAPPVVAIHGITATSRAWLAVSRALGDRVCLIAPDLRGRGASRAVGPPFGLDAHADDVLALMDRLGLQRPVIAGHSLGAYVACRFAVRHPDRVGRLVLVDGGLSEPGGDAIEDPDAVIDALLGPAVARLRTEYPDRDAYRTFWDAHPALADSDGDPELLHAYADYDLCGEPPRLHSSVVPEVVPADGRDVLLTGDAQHLDGDAVLLHAPRGLDGHPPPLQPTSSCEAWVAGRPDRRRAVLVPDCNHYTIAMGAAGAQVVAVEITAAATALDSGPAFA